MHIHRQPVRYNKGEKKISVRAKKLTPAILHPVSNITEWAAMAAANVE
jgi:hypothetical protein